MRWIVVVLLAGVGAVGGLLATQAPDTPVERALAAIVGGTPADWAPLRITAAEWDTHCPVEVASYKAKGEATQTRLDHLWRKAGRWWGECRAFPWQGAKRVWDDRRVRAPSDRCAANVTRYSSHSYFYENGEQTFRLKFLRSYVLPDGRQVLVKPPRCRKSRPVRQIIAERFAIRMCLCKEKACAAEADAYYREALAAAKGARAPDEAMQGRIEAETAKAEACRAKLGVR